MKKKAIILALATLIFGAPLSAQDDLGTAAEAAAKTSSDWQNWAFAGGSLVAAAIGALVVATNSGSTSH